MMKIVLKTFLLMVTLMGCYSAFAGELPVWREEPALQLNGHQLRYGSMDYGDNCQGYSNIGVVILHGSTPESTSDTGGAFGVVYHTTHEADPNNPELHLRPEGNLLQLAKWLRRICVRVVAPDSGLKFSLQNNRKDYKRWDSDNSLGGSERKQIIQLMDKMISEQGVTELYVMGFSSGSMMTHNVSQELINNPYGANEKVRKALKGIVMADGISANQVHTLDNEYIGVDDAWWNKWFITDITDIGGLPGSAPPNSTIACKPPSDKLVSTTLFARRHGIYIDGSEEITGLLGNKKWEIPTLIINSLHDSAINPCLKTHFAQSMNSKGGYTGPEFGHSVRIQYVNTHHDGSTYRVGFPLIQRALLDAHNSP